MTKKGGEDEGGIRKAIRKAVKKNPPPKGTPSKLIEEVYVILESHQYRINRSRPKVQIRRLIESLDWGD